MSTSERIPASERDYIHIREAANVSRSAFSRSSRPVRPRIESPTANFTCTPRESSPTSRGQLFCIVELNCSCRLGDSVEINKADHPLASFPRANKETRTPLDETRIVVTRGWEEILRGIEALPGSRFIERENERRCPDARFVSDFSRK